MFLAMTMSLPGYLCCTNSEERGKLSWRVVGLLVIPSSFDLVGTALAKVGLLYVTVSLYQVWPSWERSDVHRVTRVPQVHT
jgi:hypothetical protein